jgi:hypothetical protein
MLKPKLLRTLHVNPDDHPRGQPHLSAASGLVQVLSPTGVRCFVVSDDEHHLGKFKLGSDEPVKLKRLFDGDLPHDAIDRKAAKPDLEVLTLLPATARYPHGALLALGSGSKPQRHGGLVLALDAQGKLGKGAALVSQRLDLTDLYAPLHAQFADLNIEGCLIHGDTLQLIHRGNKGSAIGQGSAAITLHLPQIMAWLIEPGDTPPPVPSRTLAIDLGDVDGVPLTPTDACLLPSGDWLLSAAAENTDDSTLDGPCTGSALVVLSPQGKLRALHMLQGAPKVEGISATAAGSYIDVLMVTDADHPDVPSQLLSVRLP